VVDTITGYVRVKAICVFRDGVRILAIDGSDPVTGERFWVPVGGRVELGETSREALIREMSEELSAELRDIKLLGVLENIFTFRGEQGHEITFVYDARFVDESVYEQSEIVGREGDIQLFTARWIEPFDPPGNRPLYPDGLDGLLKGSH
jgi:ADP-ribose pyrophosphatase YjhB (NUDIX family)